MATPTLTDKRQLAAGAAQVLNAAIEHEEEMAELASMDDSELLAVFGNNLKTVNRENIVKAAQEGSVALARIARLLSGQLSPEFLIQANEEALTARQMAVKSGEAFTSGAFTEKLHISRQALNKAVQANRIFCLEMGGDNYYPGFYCDPDLERRQLETIAKALGDFSGWQKWQFFTTPKASLGGQTPIAALKDGQFKQALTAAKGFAER